MGKQRGTRTTRRKDRESEVSTRTALAAEIAPEAQTIVYIHGIGNKPPADVLKCQWDTALYGHSLGDRSRMAYWVNRAYYPQPEAATCADEDRSVDQPGSITSASAHQLAIPWEADIDSEIAALTQDPVQASVLRTLVGRIRSERESSASQETRAAAVLTAKVLPLPGPLRDWVTRQLTRLLLRDVNDFLFHSDRRQTMEDTLRERLDAGGGPFVVIAHSQGTMIAYDVLRQLPRADYDVRLFVTMGSPLGLQEVRDVFEQWIGGPSPWNRPACVAKWVNVADRLDPVAAHFDLTDVYPDVENYADFFLNPDSPRHPHSGTGYLTTAPVKQAVTDAVGVQFGQATGAFVVARDLVNDLEARPAGQRHPVLIQLADPDAPDVAARSRDQLVAGLREIVGERNYEHAQVDPLKRFVAAQLTRREVEQLRTRLWQAFGTESGGMNVKVWRDSVKRALICDSCDTVQTRPASLGYGAAGLGITWAVLDTGVQADHPHFATNKNVAVQWDCTEQGRPVEVYPTGFKKGTVLDAAGHGTHVAGIIAGQSPQSLPLQNGGRPVAFNGMAPLAVLHSYKVLDDQGKGQDSWIIKALDHIDALNDQAGKLVIHGINLSLGGSFDRTVYGCGHSPLCQELRRLWNQGVLVCLAAGNEGYELLDSEQGVIEANMALSIGDPANLDEAIAIGSVHKTKPHTYGVSYFSSRGPTADGRRKPDVVAPGERIWSASHKFKDPAAIAQDLYVQMSGTSMAAPHVSGVLAAFLSLRTEFMGQPGKVKEILLHNCTDLERDPYVQGKGLPNLIKMLALT
jgi:subtilisin family serine protease